MGKKSQRHSWPEAKKACRLNQLDIAMAKHLGFGPDALIQAIPSPKQKWKMTVKDWVRELHAKRFGHVLGEKPAVKTPEYVPSEKEVRLFEEEFYWEDYHDRNMDAGPAKATKSTSISDVTDDDLPF